MLAGQLEMSGLKALALKRFQSQLRGDWRVENLVDYIEEIYENQKPNQHCLLLRPIVAEAALAYFLFFETKPAICFDYVCRRIGCSSPDCIRCAVNVPRYLAIK